MWKPASALLLGATLCSVQALAQAPAYDGELAKSLGADARGMRNYVLVLLRTGPTKMPAGPERSKMFQGHAANITRLAAEKKLAAAGPLDGVNGMRGLFVLAVDSIDEAKALVATDPVIVEGEMVADYHKFFSSAALMAVGGIHEKIQKK